MKNRDWMGLAAGAAFAIIAAAGLLFLAYLLFNVLLFEVPYR